MTTVENRPRTRPDRRQAPSARGLLLRFAVAGILALAILTVATAVFSRRIAEREGIKEAKRVALASGRGVLEPALTNGIVRMNPDAMRAVDKIVRAGVLGGSLVRVKLWRADATIIYSDEGRLVGRRFTLGANQRRVLSHGGIAAEVSELDKPENQYERPQGKLLEAYLPLETPDRTRLLFEAYFRYEGVADIGRSIWVSFVPLTIGALVLLELIQFPLAWSLARSLRRSQEDREVLLLHAVDSSDRERGRIARDLHDGVVQDLTGVSYALAAAARGNDVRPADRSLFEKTGEQVRDSIGALRSLLVDIYPPNLREEGLRTALEDLLAGVATRGIETSTEFALDERQLSGDVEALLYRGAQEAVRNVLSHADARNVRITVRVDARRAVLTVEDDGGGFDAGAAGAVTESGHVGLRALADLVAEAGGTVEVVSAPGAGTEIRVEVPLAA